MYNFNVQSIDENVIILFIPNILSIQWRPLSLIADIKSESEYFAGQFEKVNRLCMFCSSSLSQLIVSSCTTTHFLKLSFDLSAC